MFPVVLLYKLWQVEVGRSRAIFSFHEGATKRLKLRNLKQELLSHVLTWLNSPMESH